MINKIDTQGRGNWYDWVTGYFLFYSQDGKRWTGYTESGDALHSNVRKCDIFSGTLLFARACFLDFCTVISNHPNRRSRDWDD